jgi:hypothetical protein
MRGAVSARMGKLVGKLSIGALGESVQGQRGPQQVATEVLELLPGSGLEGHIGVPREALQPRAPQLLPVYHRGGGAQPPHGMASARRTIAGAGSTSTTRSPCLSITPCATSPAR